MSRPPSPATGPSPRGRAMVSATLGVPHGRGDVTGPIAGWIMARTPRTFPELPSRYARCASDETDGDTDDQKPDGCYPYPPVGTGTARGSGSPVPSAARCCPSASPEPRRPNSGCGPAPRCPRWPVSDPRLVRPDHLAVGRRLTSRTPEVAGPSRVRPLPPPRLPRRQAPPSRYAHMSLRADRRTHRTTLDITVVVLAPGPRRHGLVLTVREGPGEDPPVAAAPHPPAHSARSAASR